MTDICLLNLVVTPAIEDNLSDWLLAREDVAGFSSHIISGHGSSEHSMSLGEQVSGRKKQVLFQLHLSCKGAETLVDQVKTDFKGSGMHFWLLPVLASGHVA